MKAKELIACLNSYPTFFPDVDLAISKISEVDLDVEVSSIQNDSRQVTKHSIFVAFEGNEFDSHNKIAEARSNGAVLVIGSKSSPGNEVDLLVESPRATIGPLINILRNNVSATMSIVGITGTNGKTTVSYLYSNMVRAQGSQCFTMGTTGILLDGKKESDSRTTPDPIVSHRFFEDFRSRSVNYGVMEVSSQGLDQFRVLGTTFKAVAFTNFSQDHLDYHESMEEYFKAKASLFSDVYSNIAVVNIDDEKGNEIVEISKRSGLKVLTVSTKDRSANVYIEMINMNLDGSTLSITINDGDDESNFEVTTDLIGDFNHENIGVALGLSIAAGLDVEKSINSLVHPDLVPGRLQRVKGDSGINVFVDYAHTPDALERVIKVIAPLSKRTIVVFGCGGDRDKSKRRLMGDIASKNADIAIVTSDNPRSENPSQIINEIMDGHSEDFIVVEDREEAIKHALEIAQSGDGVIVAGKGHERGQVFADHTDDFSDVEVTQNLLQKMTGA